MATDGQQVTGEGEEWRPWEPEHFLRTLTPNEVRFSSGFLRADFEKLFGKLRAHWLPLFHSLESELQFRTIEKSFEFPEKLRRKFVVEIEGELAVIAVDTRSERTIAHAVAPSSTSVGVDAVIEYLARRLVSSLSKSWSGEDPLRIQLVRAGELRDGSIVAAVRLGVTIGGTDCDIWFGLGPRAVERLDATVRDSGSSIPTVEGGGRVLTVEIAELLVPPELLIDYLRPETVIGLDLPVRADVIVRLDERPWALGRLGQYRGKLAVDIVDFNPSVASDIEGNTRLRVEIARLNLTPHRVTELTHRGAVILTENPVSPQARLVISGEAVGSALVGTIGGQFALSVLANSEG